MIGIESDNNTFAWLGIPFAEPPVGNLRWKAPLQPKAFNSKFEANQFADMLVFNPEACSVVEKIGWDQKIVFI